MAIVIQPPIASDDDLIRIGKDNPGYQIEREEDGTIVMSPTHTRGGAKSGEALWQLINYAKRVGGKAYDSNTGFAIGPKLRLKCPDASWVSQGRIEAVPAEQLNKFWGLSPDVAIEIKSDTDDFETTIAKVKLYIERGSRYAVAIDPDSRDVKEQGNPPLGLVLDFDAIIDA